MPSQFSNLNVFPIDVNLASRRCLSRSEIEVFEAKRRTTRVEKEPELGSRLARCGCANAAGNRGVRSQEG